MQDITNNINNVGKPIPARKIDVRLTIRELSVIQGLAQNPHEAYQDNTELMAVAKDIFNVAEQILDYQARN